MFNPATAPYGEYFLNPFKAAAASFAVEAITAPIRDMSELWQLSRSRRVSPRVDAPEPLRSWQRTF